MRSKRIALTLVTILILLLAVFAIIYIEHQNQLSRIHEEELRPYIQRYLDLHTTIAGWLDPDVIAQVATGEQLNLAIRTRCRDCPSVELIMTNHIVTLEVLEYAETKAKVRVRWEYAWHQVDPKTGGILGPCHAQARTIQLFLTRQDNLWKVSDSGGLDAADVNPVDDTPELRAKYCSTN